MLIGKVWKYTCSHIDLRAPLIPFPSHTDRNMGASGMATNLAIKSGLLENWFWRRSRRAWNILPTWHMNNYMENVTQFFHAFTILFHVVSMVTVVIQLTILYMLFSFSCSKIGLTFTIFPAAGLNPAVANWLLMSFIAGRLKFDKTTARSAMLLSVTNMPLVNSQLRN